MARCIECSSYNPYYRGGWCDYHDRETSPSDSCACSDCNGSHIDDDSSKVCRTCESFDPNYCGGYCDYHECTTNSDSYCSSWS